jgi:hypothetical protein
LGQDLVIEHENSGFGRDCPANCSLVFVESSSGFFLQTTKCMHGAKFIGQKMFIPIPFPIFECPKKVVIAPN